MALLQRFDIGVSRYRGNPWSDWLGGVAFSKSRPLGMRSDREGKRCGDQASQRMRHGLA